VRSERVAWGLVGMNMLLGLCPHGLRGRLRAFPGAFIEKRMGKADAATEFRLQGRRNPLVGIQGQRAFGAASDAKLNHGG
jgi:hypothetical protein